MTVTFYKKPAAVYANEENQTTTTMRDMMVVKGGMTVWEAFGGIVCWYYRVDRGAVEEAETRVCCHHDWLLLDLTGKLLKLGTYLGRYLR